mgnify:CR=1 FL=1
MQKKQVIQFSVLLTAILVMAGVYFGIRSYNKNQELQEAQEEAAVITLTSFEPESVTAISCESDGVQYSYRKEGEEWKDADDSEAILDQDKFADFLKQAGSIEAEEEVEGGDDAEYGFGNPVRTVTITTTNGTSSLIFGMENEMLGQYYVKTSESSKIYLVEASVPQIFDKTNEDFEVEDTDTDADSDTE